MPEFRMPTTDEARTEFWKVKAEYEAKMEAARPFREAYDAKSAEIEKITEQELEPLRVKMHAAEDGCHELQQRIARLSAFLKGATGAPPAASA